MGRRADRGSGASRRTTSLNSRLVLEGRLVPPEALGAAEGWGGGKSLAGNFITSGGSWMEVIISCSWTERPNEAQGQ